MSDEFPLRPYQEKQIADVFGALEKGITKQIISSPTGSGKCLGYNTEVLMYNGTIKKVQDVKVGDKLMSPDSTPRNVLSISNGYGEMVRIVPRKGISWECNLDHILTLVNSYSKKSAVDDISVFDYLYNSSNYYKSGRKQYFPENGIDFPGTYEELPIDPYFFGLFIGDGNKGCYKSGKLRNVRHNNNGPGNS